jgi:hypothetical protein
VVIVWLLDLQLPVQSVPIATKVVSSNPVHGKVCSIQHYVKKFVSDLRSTSAISLMSLLQLQQKSTLPMMPIMMNIIQ